MKKQIITMIIVCILIVIAIVPISVSINQSSIKIIYKSSNFINNYSWIKQFGGENKDVGYDIKITSNGGYIITGSTVSYGTGNNKKPDLWLLRTDANGNELWNKTFGNEYTDEGYCCQETSDGGFIIVGKTWSNEKNSDLWLIKTNENGELQWKKSYGYEYDDIGYSVEQTNDGGYIISGSTGYSYHEENDFDIWILKIDHNGELEWDKTIYGDGQDDAMCIIQTNDNGYILTGTYADEYRNYNIILIKMDENGNEEWTEMIGGYDFDYGYNVIQTSDGGYTVVGGSYSFDIFPGILIKVDENGSIIFLKNYYLALYDIQQTPEGGYLLSGGRFGGGMNEFNPVIVKITQMGDIQWQEEYSDNIGFLYALDLTNDGGSISIGFINHEDTDENVFLIKLGNKNPDNTSIDGMINGKYDTLYNYTFIGIDPDGHDIYYEIDWGDGTEIKKLGPFESGTEIVYGHVWDKEDTYIIKARTIDIYNATGKWTMLEVSMPKIRPLLNYFGNYPILFNLFNRFLNI